MAIYDVSNPTYNNKMRKLEKSDPAHANLFNPLFQQLLENDECLKHMIEIISRLFDCTYESRFNLLNIPVGCIVIDKTLILPERLGNVDDENKTLVLLKGIDIGGNDEGITTETIFPIATKNRLGGVKIGEGITVEEDGTISTNIDISAEKAATLIEANMEEYTPEEIRELFKQV